MKIKFSKMHGLGNDFVVTDSITQQITLSTPLIQRMSNRHFGIGFDQLLLVEAPDSPDIDFKYRIFNADGSEVEQCGNGIRCFARYVHEHNLTKKKKIKVSTKSGIVEPEINADAWVKVNMGLAKQSPAQIPFTPNTQQLNEPRLTYTIPFQNQDIEFGVVNMGNPHAVVLVNDINTAPVPSVGAFIESHPQFPNRVNVGFMQVINPQEIYLRVYERGAGETLACGTGACAAVVSGIARGLLTPNTPITVHLKGGDLSIVWSANNVVWMTGPTAQVYDGVFYTESFDS